MNIFSCSFSSLQLKTLMIVGIIAGVAALFCFITGEISRNNSQMDKLWSVLPIIYTWLVMFMSKFNFRCIIIAVLVTFWGIRLTVNFAMKGAYSIKFWTGKEDYRWPYLREKNLFRNKFVWALFDLFFISIFQNFVVLAITLPSISVMESVKPFNVIDGVAIFVALGAIVYEMIADIQQMKFQNTKWKMINEGKKLEELPMPYCIGFNTKGLWSVSRHPNYIGEQLTWVGIYLFVISGYVAIFDITIVGCVLLILIFVGSSRLSEKISSSKYPLYKDYKKKVLKYLPFRKYHI